ncbi:MAG: peptidylprolyl isomerase [Nitrospirae bacterium]|nr:peptidylprolyl isomerase [Nitrospirota bacterium]
MPRRPPFTPLHAALGVVLACALAACGDGGGGGSGGVVAKSGAFPEVVLSTSKGDIRFEMDPEFATETINLVSGLILTGGYDNQPFFDVQPGRFVQFGNPDPEQAQTDSIPVELTGNPLDRGYVAMAWVGSKNNTTHRLIFPLSRLDPALDDHFTVFGRILEGDAVLDRIVPGDKVLRISTRLARPIIRLVTTRGSIVIELDPDVAPNHVERISTLTCQGFYNGVTFHRVEGELVQTGDPTGVGTGGSGQKIPAEINNRRFFRTSVGMAREPGDLDSADSQFFIMKTQVRALDGQYTYFGKVLAGMDSVDQIQLGDVVQDASLQFDLAGRNCVGSAEPPPDNAGFGGTTGGTTP